MGDNELFTLGDARPAWSLNFATQCLMTVVYDIEVLKKEDVESYLDKKSLEKTTSFFKYGLYGIEFSSPLVVSSALTQFIRMKSNVLVIIVTDPEKRKLINSASVQSVLSRFDGSLVGVFDDPDGDYGLVKEKGYRTVREFCQQVNYFACSKSFQYAQSGVSRVLDGKKNVVVVGAEEPKTRVEIPADFPEMGKVSDAKFAKLEAENAELRNNLAVVRKAFEAVQAYTEESAASIAAPPARPFPFADKVRRRSLYGAADAHKTQDDRPKMTEREFLDEIDRRNRTLRTLEEQVQTLEQKWERYPRSIWKAWVAKINTETKYRKLLDQEKARYIQLESSTEDMKKTHQKLLNFYWAMKDTPKAHEYIEGIKLKHVDWGDQFNQQRVALARQQEFRKRVGWIIAAVVSFIGFLMTTVLFLKSVNII